MDGLAVMSTGLGINCSALMSPDVNSDKLSLEISTLAATLGGCGVD